MNKSKRIELLAPAKNVEYGIAAIDCGADAVYIGGPRFGARSAAGNSVADIARLAEYAHVFGAKVYVALNTLLFDNELTQAQAIAAEVWHAGADALIVQDMAFAAMPLPPIELHCSTQTFNMSAEKIGFFEKAGFSRVILERALIIDEIKNIRETTSIELETFVHGAICVCFSGQCYMSHVISGRSGNRGECLQQCRWDYDLVDAGGKKILREKHLLSVADLDLSANLAELIAAGVTSFKIEGRLKDLTYLKNSVSHYRLRLDEIISADSTLRRASSGTTVFDFVPDPRKSFSRGFTTYYLHGTGNKVSSFDTPKSTGQYIGEVGRVGRDNFTLDSPVAELANGDGICFLSREGKYMGTNINLVGDAAVFPDKMEGITPGTSIYRNYDRQFVRKLENSKTRRAIGVKAEICMSNSEISLRLTDLDGFYVEKSVTGNFDEARNPEKARETIISQVGKTGDTPFNIIEFTFKDDCVLFVTSSVINALRRDALEALKIKRLTDYRREERKSGGEHAVYPETTLSCYDNVTNSLSEKFYRDHGVTNIEKGVELSGNQRDITVMRTRYCIRRETGQCLLEKGTAYRGALRIVNTKNTFDLEFDCAKCEMSIIYHINTTKYSLPHSE